MKYELVSWHHNWADEMDFDGERIQPAGNFYAWMKDLRRGLSFPYSVSAGSNETIDFESADELFSDYNVKPFEITDEEYEVLKKFGRLGDSDKVDDQMEGFGEHLYVATCINGHLGVPDGTYNYQTRRRLWFCKTCHADIPDTDITSISPFFYCPETDDHVDYVEGDGRPNCEHGPASWDTEDLRDEANIEALFGPREIR